MSDTNISAFLTNAEAETLIQSLATARKGASFTEEEAITLLQEAEKIRIQSTILDMVLKGRFYADIDQDGHMTLSGPEEDAQ